MLAEQSWIAVGGWCGNSLIFFIAMVHLGRKGNWRLAKVDSKRDFCGNNKRCEELLGGSRVTMISVYSISFTLDSILIYYS